MAGIKKLTPTLLRRMVLSERRKMLEVLKTSEESLEKVAAKTEEVPADELADSIEQEIDWLKALKIKENKLRKRLVRVSEVKKRLKKRVIRKL
tara:strand:- start:102 stop:380 length:279 start_codon:yes stop_codon:yes gene_type:complete